MRARTPALSSQSDFSVRAKIDWSPSDRASTSAPTAIAMSYAPDATAYAGRDARFVMNVHGRWESPNDDSAMRQYATDSF